MSETVVNWIITQKQDTARDGRLRPQWRRLANSTKYTHCLILLKCSNMWKHDVIPKTGNTINCVGLLHCQATHTDKHVTKSERVVLRHVRKIRRSLQQFNKLRNNKFKLFQWSICCVYCTEHASNTSKRFL